MKSSSPLSWRHLSNTSPEWSWISPRGSQETCIRIEILVPTVYLILIVFLFREIHHIGCIKVFPPFWISYLLRIFVILKRPNDFFESPQGRFWIAPTILNRPNDFWIAPRPSVSLWGRFSSLLWVFLGKLTSRNTMKQLFPHWDHYFSEILKRPKDDKLIFHQKFVQISAKFSSPLQTDTLQNVVNTILLSCAPFR